MKKLFLLIVLFSFTVPTVSYCGIFGKSTKMDRNKAINAINLKIQSLEDEAAKFDREALDLENKGDFAGAMKAQQLAQAKKDEAGQLRLELARAMGR